MNMTASAGLGLIVLVISACGTGSSAPPSAGPTPAGPAPTSAPTANVSVPPAPTAGAFCQPGPGRVAVWIDAEANLFGAGLDRPPAPGGGGGGVLPPLIELPAGGATLVTFPCTGGRTDCCSGAPSIGPAGWVGGQTDVESHGGIAGLMLADRQMFLAGVFIGDGAPAAPAPERLDFSGNVKFERLEPGLGQTFYIGDGVGKTFVAPDGATRLYLGFVDGYLFLGEPGWYGNNTGFLEATVEVVSE